MMTDKMGENIRAAPGFGELCAIDMELCLAVFVAMQAGIWNKASERAGDVEIVAILVGAGTGNRIVIGDGVGFTSCNVIAEFRAAGMLIGRTGPGWATAQLRIEAHQFSGTAHRLRVFRGRTKRRVGEADDAIVGPGGDGELGAVFEQEADEIDMRLAGIETGIEMSEGDAAQRPGAHDGGGLDDKPHGQLHGLAGGAVEKCSGVVRQFHPQPSC